MQDVTFCSPRSDQFPQLRALWKEVFRDTDLFLDQFQTHAFSPDRCMCALHKDQILAMLYWFDCSCYGHTIAYIYAVATAPRYRGLGICHELLAHTHRHLCAKGYAGALLAPASEELFDFYASMGYQTATYIRELRLTYEPAAVSDKEIIPMHPIKKDAFIEKRAALIPDGGVLQEKENIDFLSVQNQFYTGSYAQKEFLLTASMNGEHADILEFLGDTALLPSILAQLHCQSAYVRTPGLQKPFTMYYPFDRTLPFPAYFGFIFD